MSAWRMTVEFDDATLRVAQVESAVLNVFGDLGTAPASWSLTPLPRPACPVCEDRRPCMTCNHGSDR